MKRDLLSAEHEDLRESFGRFLDAEVVPHYESWERAGRIPATSCVASASWGSSDLGCRDR
jgi:hypothetical protein